MGNKASTSTEYHIALVNTLVRSLIAHLVFQTEQHDRSKLQSPEKEMFEMYGHKLSGMTFGSKEYAQCLKELGPALKHHYENNRHHPQHFKNGVEGMNLIDLLEMFCDWKASCLRMKAGGDFDKSIEINAKRFKMSKQLKNIFQNTRKLLGD